jgi:hypothetical protein
MSSHDNGDKRSQPISRRDADDQPLGVALPSKPTAASAKGTSMSSDTLVIPESTK